MDRETAHADGQAGEAKGGHSTILTHGWPALPAAGVLVYLLLRLAFDQGGYFPAAFTPAAAIAFVALALFVIVPPRRRIRTPALVALAALAAFACWTGLSRAWSVVPDIPLLDMRRAMLYVALFALGLLAADSARRAGLVVWGVLGVVTVVVGVGVLSRLQPDLISTPVLIEGAREYRLSYPLGYWNAFGALATIGGVLAVGLAADARAARVPRALAAGAAVLLLVAMYLSLSRGSFLALLAGVVVLLVLSRRRGTLLVSLAIVAAGVGIALLVLRSHPALVELARTPEAQEAQGDAYMIRLLVLVVLAAIAQWLAAAVTIPQRMLKLMAAARRPAIALACAAVLLVVLAGLIVRDGAGDRPVDRLSSTISKQWDDFVSPTAPLEGAEGTARLTSAKSSRSDTYRVAIDGFQAHPLRGEGAGSYEVRWMRDRAVDDKVRDAHSLALQTLAELGLVGFALLAAFAGAVLFALARTLQGRGALRRSQAAAVGAAFTVWLVHSSIDWDWEMPAVTGVALVLGATLFAASGRRRRTGARRPRTSASAAR